MTLNDEQLEAYNAVLHDTDKVIMLKGKAGSGKSTTVQQIVKDFKGTVLVTATTNKAKNILQENLDCIVRTTHSAMGFNMKNNGTEKYLAQMREPLTADLIVIDEVSMLPRNVWEKVKSLNFKKILLVGDEAQLPAVGLVAKPEVDREIILVRQMRQEDDEKLEAYLDTIREAILNDKQFSFSKDLPESIELIYNHKDFCKTYMSCTTSKKILAYSNRCVDSYNLNANDNNKFIPGEELVIDKPLGKARNGDLVTLVSYEDLDEGYSLRLDFKGEIYDCITFKTKAQEKDFLDKILKESPNEYHKYSDIIVHPKQLYASTVHKAQGMTIDTVFVDVWDIYQQTQRKPSRFNNYNQPISKTEFFKLLYVAISRMRQKAYLFVGKERDYKTLRKEK